MKRLSLLLKDQRRTAVERWLSAEVGTSQLRRERRAGRVHVTDTPDDARRRFHGDDRQLRITDCRWSRYDEQTNGEQDDVGEIDVIELQPVNIQINIRSF